MMFYECDFNALPFKKVIMTVFGTSAHSGYALECYRKHQYIYKSSCGSIYGADQISDKSATVKLSAVLMSINLGRL